MDAKYENELRILGSGSDAEKANIRWHYSLTAMRYFMLATFLLAVPRIVPPYSLVDFIDSNISSYAWWVMGSLAAFFYFSAFQKISAYLNLCNAVSETQ